MCVTLQLFGWTKKSKSLRGYFHHFLNKSGVVVMLSVFFPVWQHEQAKVRCFWQITGPTPESSLPTWLTSLFVFLPSGLHWPLHWSQEKLYNDEILTVHNHRWTTQVVFRTCKSEKGSQTAGMPSLSHGFSSSTGSSTSSPTSELMSY